MLLGYVNKAGGNLVVFFFVFSDLPFGHMATYFGLIKLPKMPELKKRKVEGFTPLKIDWNTIKYK